jgi:hypothetical protein
MIDDFHQVINLHGFKGYRNLTGSIHINDLFAGKTVACHSARAVRQIDLQVLVDAIVVILSHLVHDLFGRVT